MGSCLEQTVHIYCKDGIFRDWQVWERNATDRGQIDWKNNKFKPRL